MASDEEDVLDDGRVAELAVHAHQMLLRVWLDYLHRGMTRSGQLPAMIADGLRGMTSNPTIFEHAIAGSAEYDDVLCSASS
jgi:transaldolase